MGQLHAAKGFCGTSRVGTPSRRGGLREAEAFLVRVVYSVEVIKMHQTWGFPVKIAFLFHFLIWVFIGTATFACSRGWNQNNFTPGLLLGIAGYSIALGAASTVTKHFISANAILIVLDNTLAKAAYHSANINHRRVFSNHPYLMYNVIFFNAWTRSQVVASRGNLVASRNNEKSSREQEWVLLGLHWNLIYYTGVWLCVH